MEGDLYAQLEEHLAEQNKSFKSAINEAVRLRLHPAADRGPEAGEVQQTRTFDLGKSSVANMDNVAELIALVEGDDHK